MGAGTSKLESNDLLKIKDIINNYNNYQEKIKKALDKPLKKLLEVHKKLESNPQLNPKSEPPLAQQPESPSESPSAPSGPSAPTASKQILETQTTGGRSRKKKGKKKNSRKK